MAADPDAPHILVIDDEPSILALYRDLLEDEGYRVTLWTVPERDPAGIHALGPDAIVLDLLIGREDLGFRFLERLKSEPATAAIPVLVCSADVDLLERARERLAAGDCGAVRKPFDIDEFLAAIRACLAKASPP